MLWDKKSIIKKLLEIKDKGFISIPPDMFRTDDGIVGQILEREFGVKENNVRLADLGVFELKGQRYKKNKPNMMTLFHKTSASGMTPIQIFDRFGYIRKSNRSEIMKKKLFTTIRGDKINSLGFMLKAISETEIQLFFHDEYLSTWDLSEAKKKINQVILAFAETTGAVNSKEEKFHYVKAFLLDEIMCLSEAIKNGAVVMDLCIDQPVDKSKGVHDRGPHIRIPIQKLNQLYKKVEPLI